MGAGYVCMDGEGMLSDHERHKILSFWAWTIGEIYKQNNILTDNNKNWRKAEESLEIEWHINGDVCVSEILKNLEVGNEG